PISDMTDAAVHFLLLKQSIYGYWPSLSHRPPLEDSPFTSTALSIRSLRIYAPKPLRHDADLAVTRAINWLKSAVPRSNEESCMQILGLIWGGAKANEIVPCRDALVRRQRP